jgi:hypothetical protein
MIVLLLLMVTGLFSKLLGPPVSALASGIFSMFGLT